MIAKLLRGAFLATLFLAPLPFGSNREWSALLLAALPLLLAAGTCVAFASGRLAPSRALRDGWPLPLLIALLAVVQFATADGAVAPALHLSHALQSSGLAAVAMLVLALCADRRGLRQLVWVLVASGVVQALYGGLMVLSGVEQSVFVAKTQHVGSATGTFISRNNYAGWLALCLALGIGLMVAQLGDGGGGGRAAARRWLDALLGEKGRLRLLLVVMVIGLVLSRSRMGNSAFFAAMLVAAGVGLLLSRRASRAQVLLFGSLVAVDVLLVGAFFGIEQVAERVQQTDFLRENRDEVVRDGLRLIDGLPLFGHGMGSWGLIYPHVRGEDVYAWYSHAHNDYLELLVDGGWPFVAGLGALLLSSLGLALWAQARRRNGLSRGMGFACVMGIVYSLVHATVDFNAQIPANAALLVVVLAIGWVAALGDLGSRGAAPGQGRRRRRTVSRNAQSVGM